VKRANQSRLDYAPLNACFRVAGAESPVTAGIARFTDPGPEGVAARLAARAALDLKEDEFNAQGVEMNQRYISAAVVPDPDAQPETFERDGLQYLQATTRPGAKIPHVWLIDRHGRKTSTLDVVGRGKLSLVTGLAGGAWTAAVDALAIPILQNVLIGGPDAQDLYCDWQRVRDIDEAGALLVRPDGYVAWCARQGVAGTSAAKALLSAALAAILDRPDLIKAGEA